MLFANKTKSIKIPQPLAQSIQNFRKLVKMSSNNNNLDMFGRDLSLKYKRYEPLFTDYVARFKCMSWAEVCFLVEDEEQVERKQVRQAHFTKIHDERKRLYAQGLYELEEGEELDYP